jgi:hypothetical protein
MIIIIDAYNILKQITSETFISDKTRNNFIDSVKWYADKRNHKVILVFDGGPYDWTHREKNGKLVTVVFSGRHESADEFIMHYLHHHSSMDILLVSSDHELGLCASHFNMPSLNALDFYGLLKDCVRSLPFVPFPHEIIAESDDLDTLMEEATEVVPSKEEDFRIPAPRVSGPHTESKKDKKLWQKLKKL